VTSLVPAHAEGGDVLALDRATCLALLATQRFGRVVFTSRALPAVLPVGFLLRDDAVLVSIRPGSALAAVAGGVVAFQADSIDAGAREGWSVTAVGRAEEVHDPALRRRVHAQLSPRAGDDHAVRIGLEQVSGRRLLPGAGAQ